MLARGAVQREAFVPGYKTATDAALLTPPPDPFTPPTLFVCTYEARLSNLRMAVAELTRRLCQNPHGCLIAVNSNYGHAAQPGCERYVKVPKAPPERRVPARGRARKVQGDGTCFNSAVEPIIRINHPGVGDDKVYMVKCFPTTGETQVPGVICPDLSDGSAVLRAVVDYLNEAGAGVPGPDGERLPVAVVAEGPNMLNYKFRLRRSCPRILVNLRALSAYLRLLEVARLAEPAQKDGLSPEQAALFAGWPAAVLPPFLVRETKPPIDDVKVSCRFHCDRRMPRVNVFQEGKVNILGARSIESAQAIFDFFQRLFLAAWPLLVCLQPRRDSERRLLARAAAAPPPPPPRAARPENANFDTALSAARLSDTDFDAALSALLDAGAPEDAGAGASGDAEAGAPTAAGTAPAAGALSTGADSARISAIQDIIANIHHWGVDLHELGDGDQLGDGNQPEDEGEDEDEPEDEDEDGDGDGATGAGANSDKA
jgi:hypothetical protein